MAALQLAVEHCLQQQQQQQHYGSNSRGSCLSSFWPVWHSYLPAGLLTVAAAAAEQLPAAHQARVSALLSGPCVAVMQQRDLLDNLNDMAEAYDEVRHAPCVLDNRLFGVCARGVRVIARAPLGLYHQHHIASACLPCVVVAH